MRVSAASSTFRSRPAGGLNSFYFKDGRKHDFGLHAMTNYVPAGPRAKGSPLNKILRQLRLTREDFDLAEQNGSRVAWPGETLHFTNDFAVLESEVARAFPREADNFRRLDAAVRAAAGEAVALDAAPRPARAALGEFLRSIAMSKLPFVVSKRAQKLAGACSAVHSFSNLEREQAVASRIANSNRIFRIGRE